MSSDRLSTVLRHVAENVRRQRLANRLTQERLAELADLDLTYVQRVEGAKTNMTIDTLVKLSDALEVEPSELLRRSHFRPRKKGRPSRR